LESLGADIFEDVQFRTFPEDRSRHSESDVERWTRGAGIDLAGDFSMDDVLQQIQVTGAWRRTRGRGVTIAIVDTGVAGELREFSMDRRSPLDIESTYQGEHWKDHEGHGSMCAAIAAGSRADGGRYNGVAPDATVLAARSTLRSTDLADIYDELLRA